MKDIKVGIIGLGCRGFGLLRDIILPQKEMVTAVCDIYPDRVERAVKITKEALGTEPAAYTDYKELLKDENVNTVVIATAWEYHVEIAVAAMRAGKATALEVGGAYSIDDCFRLVRTYEETNTPFMFLENCCYGRRELMALNMAKQGLFGTIVHMDGAYMHDLRNEIAFGKENRHYRLRNYLSRNCENYPTHELGPIAKILGINHGNRMMYLTSMASGAHGLHEYVMKKKSDDEELKNATFAQGDIVTTTIKCANGETITLKLDTTLPRYYYSRNFTVRGTAGMYEEVTDSVCLEMDEDKKTETNWHRAHTNNAVEYEEEYDHPIWKQYLKDGVQGTHDGMDWLEFKTFFAALKNDEPMPIDVYDAASWMAISVLSEESINKGGAPVDIPDFTGGKWIIK